ncbi:MAG: hypothetical protein RSD40_04790, partial [Bacilli bacterium]
LFNKNEIEEELVHLINNLDLSFLSWSDRDNLIEILKYVAENNLLLKTDKLHTLIKMLSQDIPSHYLIESFATLIKENETLSELISNAKQNNKVFYSELQNNIDKSWETVSEKYITDATGIDQTTDIEELENIIIERKNAAIKINADIGLDSSEAIREYEFDISSQIEGNKENSEDKDIIIQGFQDNLKKEKLDIDRLFNSNHDNKNKYSDKKPF